MMRLNLCLQAVPSFSFRAVALSVLALTLGLGTQARAADSVNFTDTAPATYQQQSGVDIPFTVGGELSRGGDVLILAWSDSERTMVKSFAHKLTAEPWVIAAEKLDGLPLGQTQLQLHLREPGGNRMVARHWVDIQAPPPAIPTIGFASGFPTTYQTGAGEPIGIALDGTLPEGADVLVLSWSDGERRMVEEFAHTLTSGPWQISTEQLDKLPAGRNNIQLLLRIPGQDHIKVSDWVDVQGGMVTLPALSFGDTAPASYEQGSGQAIPFFVDGTLPEGGEVGVVAYSEAEQRTIDSFAFTLTGEPWVIPAAKLDTLPVGPTTLRLRATAPNAEPTIAQHTLDIQPKPVVVPTIGFTDSFPSTYQLGSSQSIYFEVGGELPAGADVLVLSWSDAESRMIDGFAHTQVSEPWQIWPARMNMLPPGRNVLQLHLRIPGMDTVKVYQSIEVLAEPTTNPDDGSGTPDDGGSTPPDDGSSDGGTGDGGTGDGGTGDGGTGDGGSTPPDDGGTTDPVGAGWTSFTKSSDTRVVYVSSSEGDDNNDGLSPQEPVRSIDRATSLMRDGRPDWMLLRCGDTWKEGFVWTKSGRSMSEPMLISTYGSGARPLIVPTGDENGLFHKKPGDDVRNLAIVGLHFYNQGANPNDPDRHSAGSVGEGLQFRGPSQNILIEDCVISFFRNNVLFEYRYDGIANITLRRNIITDAYSTGSHSQGIYAQMVDGLTIEENVFDRNGWNPDVSGAERTIFNHNMYLQYNCKDVVVQGNISARAASHGLQHRAGGIAANNLLIRNAIGMHSGGSEGGSGLQQADHTHVYKNVVMESDDISSSYRRGVGMDVLRTKTGVWEDNIIVNRLSDNEKAGMQMADDERSGSQRIVIRNNVVTNWCDGNGDGIAIADYNRDDVALSGNIVDGRRIDNNVPVTFFDAKRNLNTYMASLGKSGGFEQFMQLVRNRGRGVWNEKLSAPGFNAYMRSGFTVVPAYD